MVVGDLDVVLLSFLAVFFCLSALASIGLVVSMSVLSYIIPILLHTWVTYIAHTVAWLLRRVSI